MAWTKQVWNGWFHEEQLCKTNQRCESAFLWQWGGHWDTKFVHGKPSQVVVVNLAMVKKINRKLMSMWNHETSQVDWKDGQVDETEPKNRPYKPWLSKSCSLKGDARGARKCKYKAVCKVPVYRRQFKWVWLDPKEVSALLKSQELWSKGTTEGTWSGKKNCQNKLKPDNNVHFKEGN